MEFIIDTLSKTAVVKNYERRLEDDILVELIAILNEKKIKQISIIHGPECDMYEYDFKGVRFFLINDLDYGIELRSDQDIEEVIKILKK